VNTHLLALESHDDLISVKDRMSWAKTPRILLIWPKGEKIALRPLDLRILQRHARALGADLGLVTRDARIRREAAALGLPVFTSPRSAQSDEWAAPVRFAPRSLRHSPAELRALREETRPPRAGWREHPVARVGFFTLGVFAVLALASLFLPRATITVTPETKTQRLTISVIADPALREVFIAGNIPTHAATRELSGSLEIASTGEAAVPEIEARGVARFRNLTASKIVIPLGTVVQTLGASPVRFKTTQEMEIGASRSVDVPIEAIGAGASGNLAIDLIQYIEGPLGLSLAVTNPAPTTGGTDRTVAAPRSEDRARLRALLMDDLRSQWLLDLLADLPRGSLIFPASIREIAVLDETYSPSVGKTGDTLALTMRVKFSAQYASGDDLAALALLAMNAALEDGFSAGADLPQIEALGTPIANADGKTTFQMQMKRPIFRTVDARRVIALAQGQSVDSALARLNESFAFAAPPQIETRPSWWPWLPLAPFRIDVVIK
jgi:hypothetical protein